jgi:hypothetical protein
MIQVPEGRLKQASKAETNPGRRARLQPCRKWPAHLTALAPEVRFSRLMKRSQVFPRLSSPQTIGKDTSGAKPVPFRIKDVAQGLKPSFFPPFTARLKSSPDTTQESAVT